MANDILEDRNYLRQLPNSELLRRVEERSETTGLETVLAERLEQALALPTRMLVGEEEDDD